MQPFPKVLFQPFKISQKTNCLSLLAFVAFFEFDCSNLLSFYCFSKCICLSFWPPTTFFFKIHDLNFSPFVKFPFCNFFQNVCIFTYTGSYISKLFSLIQVFLYWEKNSISRSLSSARQFKFTDKEKNASKEPIFDHYVPDLSIQKSLGSKILILTNRFIIPSFFPFQPFVIFWKRM